MLWGVGMWQRPLGEGGGSEWVYIHSPQYPYSFNQSSLPPSPKTFVQVAEAYPTSTHPGFIWVGDITPSIDYRLTIPQWTTAPGNNGELASAVMRYEVNSTINTIFPELSRANTGIAISFQLTETRAISFSGGTFYDSTQTPIDITQHMDHRGYLLPGNYIYAVITRPGSFSMSLSLTPPPIDTDGDGLLDLDEINVHHTDPNKADTDGDGLSDKQEIQTTFSSPLLADTDGDGFMDGIEWKSGKSPTNPLSFPDAAISIHPAIELRVVTKLGTSYRVQFSADMTNWTDTETLIQGTGSEIRRIFEPADEAARFWRVKAVD